MRCKCQANKTKDMKEEEIYFFWSLEEHKSCWIVLIARKDLDRLAVQTE